MTITLNEKVINSYKSVFGYEGTLLLVFGSSLLLLIISCIFYPDEINQIVYFVVTGVIFMTLCLFR
ncbi:hypothetical protein AZF37_03630 [endosymbiont 'TC1' of Trimyema compressum]|nr:hypothetical protein AZF37_03630 [endosymbiont 'TC1' of Trimyema compressum]